VQTRRGKAGKNYRVPEVRKGDRGPKILHIFLLFLVSIIICRLYKLILSEQTPVALPLKVSLSDLVQRFLIGPPLLQGPNPLSTTLVALFFVCRGRQKLNGYCV